MNKFKKVFGFAYLAILSVVTFFAIQVYVAPKRVQAQLPTNCPLSFTKYTPRLSYDNLTQIAKVQGFNAHCWDGQSGCNFNCIWYVSYEEPQTGEMLAEYIECEDHEFLCNYEQVVSVPQLDLSTLGLTPGVMYNVSFSIYRGLCGDQAQSFLKEDNFDITW